MNPVRLATWHLAAILGLGLPAVGLFSGVSMPWLAIAASLLGSGAALALLLIPEMSVLLLFGTSFVFGVATLLFHGLLARVFPVFGSTVFLPCLAWTSLVIGGVAVLILWRTRWPRTLSLVARGDALFLLAFVPVVASALFVTASNGYTSGPDGRFEFHARGFVNGDTMTLFALTNASGSRELGVGSRDALLRANPFAGNGPLEYPTLLHEALARVMRASGADITSAAWWLILPVLAGTVAVSALSAKYVFREQRLPWWTAVLLLVAYGTTWESFTYPQSHTFLTGLFVLFVLLLVRRDRTEHVAERRVLRFAVGGLAILLLFSNAVLGAAAVAVAVGSNILQFFNRSWPWRDRVSGLFGSAILLILFFLFPPGTSSLGTLNVAYTAVPQFLVAALPALLVLWGLWDTRWLHRSTSLLSAAVVLPALAVITLVLSSRDIIAENSPRFLFLLVLLGWPAVVPVIQRVADWWWRQVRHVEQTFAEQAVLWCGGLFALIVLLLPTVASVTGTLDILVRKPPLVVSADELKAFAWIRANTAPDAVFLKAPESLFENPRVSPLALPAFTGRAQLRSEYWLSPDDAVLAGVRRFFADGGAAPERAAYLFCGEEGSACPAVGRLAAQFGRVRIRILR